MESDALPYTLFLILLELSLGTTLVMAAVDLRGQATRGFIKATTMMIPFGLGLALWLSLTLEGEAVEGYRLDTGPLDPIRVVLAGMTVVSVLHNGALYAGRERTGRALGVGLSVLAVVVLVLVAVMLRLPAWGFGLVFLSLVAGSLALGLAAVGLMLGHWYLVTPRLPTRPLNEVTGLLVLVILTQIALLIAAATGPVDETPLGGRDKALLDNLAFWLRIGVGLAFPLVLAWMAWASSRLGGMMSATGLLYLGTAAIFAGEIAARALLFDSGRAV